MSAATTTVRPRPAGPARPGGGSALRGVLAGNGVVTVLAIVLSLVISAVLIVLTDEDVTEAAGYFLARPQDTLEAAWEAVAASYAALFRGAVFNYRADDLTGMLYPLMESLTLATPLIIISLGVAIAFRSGLFNIGGQGQMILGAMVATWFGVHVQLPVGLHLLLVLVMGVLGGALWGTIVGALKALTGAHEVILTIMLNYVAVNLVAYLLQTPVLQREGSTNPVSDFLAPTALFPPLLGGAFRLNWGFVVAVLATVFAWWLVRRSTIGFQLRALGANPEAARTAGMPVRGLYVVAMAISGGLAGLAGMAQVSGTEKVLNTDVAGSYGFDAITVALLGRSNPVGVFFAGLLFGALRAGGVTMQTETGVPIDIVLIIQSLIVLFIAAPPLVRTIFRLPRPGALQARTAADPVTQPALAGAVTTAPAGGTAPAAVPAAVGEAGGAAAGDAPSPAEAGRAPDGPGTVPAVHDAGPAPHDPGPPPRGTGSTAADRPATPGEEGVQR
ncbi:ABC transporter permease [Citricoccus sp. SGAir0253]|uniref:ABC transporter permease n=1 Tax=Citricoccus sp. SGAir0253 TaxID=2567881 RepID=UPI0010CD311F|nr:ABC transporter permease [Citricoccus sp. SGAir0253]